MTALCTYWSQLRPAAPSLTETNLPPQSGKIFLVTGGNSGVGYELCKILYSSGARVYMASRSASNATAAIAEITKSVSTSSGELKFLQLDLGDLSTIKNSAEAFAAQEERLDVLWNNAGVATPPVGSTTKQGHELQIGTNCLGPFLFTQLLLPQLRAAAMTAPANSVRIVWTSSMLVDAKAPTGGISIPELSAPTSDQNRNYAMSKAGNWLLASEFASRVGGNGIVSLTQNPGNLRTKIWDKAPKIAQILTSPVLHDAKLGAYTGLWTGLSEEVTIADGGRYVVPWGRWHPQPRKDIVKALKGRGEGGTGEAEAFWRWCEEQTVRYS
ncbi:putative steroid dehydrogenase [Wilcoxina mikolae CBS 423.85]|nr:putative steroid dehydrogenase [Wilcoxina mikolae CBS 423.85]